MRATIFVLLLSTIALGCSKRSECERAFDKELACSDMPDEDKKEMKELRQAKITACNADKSNPRMKLAIRCAKKKTCDEFRTCQLKARSGNDVDVVEESIAAGRVLEALKTCSYRLDSYKAAAAFKEVCEKAFAAVFAKLDDKETRENVHFACTASSDGKEWIAISPTFKAGCEALKTQLEGLITKERDAATEIDYSACAEYKELVNALDDSGVEAAEMLCREAHKAQAYSKAVAAANKNIADKKSNAPYECKSFFSDEDKFSGSEWFAGKAAELATICYSELGKIVLAGVSSHCPLDAKDTHRMAAKYKLAAGDAELAALLTKTEATCK